MTPTMLVLRALKLGDLLVAVPALRGLRRAFPAHRIVLATTGWLAPAVDLVGAVDEMLPVPGLDAPIPLAPGSVDVAVNLHGSGARSRRLVGDLRAPLTIAHRIPAVPGDPREPVWRDDLHERERWVRLVGAFGVDADPGELALDPPRAAPALPSPTVVHVGAAYGSRCWPEERFAAITAALSAAGHDVLVTGGEADRARAVAVAERAGLDRSAVAAGRMDLDVFIATIAAARLVVSADTGAAHVASAYGRPSVVLFGPAPVAEWGPPPGPHIALTDESVRRGDAFAPDPDPALLAVTPADVLEAIDRLDV